MINVEKIQFRKIDYSYYKLHYEKLKNVYIEGSISINWKNRNKINSLITAYNNFDFILKHMITR